MLLLPLASISFWWKLFAFLWVLMAAGLILIVLIQKGRGGGLGAAFGGGGSNSLLGTKTGDFLTWVTISLVSLFLLGAVVMGKYMRPQETGLAPLPMPIPQQQPLTAPEMPTPEQAEHAAQGIVEQVQGQAETVVDDVESIIEQAEPVEE